MSTAARAAGTAKTYYAKFQSARLGGILGSPHHSPTTTC